METKRPAFFSIITVTLNNRGGLERTWRSLEAQSCRDFEWIVIDGGSTDGTAEFLRDVAHVSEPDRGIFDAMNKGIDHANGEYVWFLNAGDEIAGADVLQEIFDSIETQGARPDFVYGDAIEDRFYKSARVPNERGMFTHHQAMIYAREKISALRYDITYKIAGDYDFTQKFLKNAAQVLYCPFAFCVFETGGVSQQQAACGRVEEFKIRKSLGMNILRNTMIFGRQTIAWIVRRHIPALYWRIKSSGNNQNASSRT